MTDARSYQQQAEAAVAPDAAAQAAQETVEAAIAPTADARLAAAAAEVAIAAPSGARMIAAHTEALMFLAGVEPIFVRTSQTHAEAVLAGLTSPARVVSAMVEVAILPPVLVPDQLGPELPATGYKTIDQLPPVDGDSYGIDVRLTADGDLQVSRAGGLTPIWGVQNCIQALILWLRCRPAELPLHEDYGSTLANSLTGTKARDQQILEAFAAAEGRVIVEGDTRFLAVRTAQARVDPHDPTRAAVRLELVLSAGEVLTVSDLADVSVSDVDLERTIDTLLDLEVNEDPADVADLDRAYIDPAREDLGELVDVDLLTGEG